MPLLSGDIPQPPPPRVKGVGDVELQGPNAGSAAFFACMGLLEFYCCKILRADTLSQAALYCCIAIHTRKSHPMEMDAG